MAFLVQYSIRAKMLFGDCRALKGWGCTLKQLRNLKNWKEKEQVH